MKTSWNCLPLENIFADFINGVGNKFFSSLHKWRTFLFLCLIFDTCKRMSWLIRLNVDLRLLGTYVIYFFIPTTTIVNMLISVASSILVWTASTTGAATGTTTNPTTTATPKQTTTGKFNFLGFSRICYYAQ